MGVIACFPVRGLGSKVFWPVLCELHSHVHCLITTKRSTHSHKRNNVACRNA